MCYRWSEKHDPPPLNYISITGYQTHRQYIREDSNHIIDVIIIRQHSQISKSIISNFQDADIH